MQTDMLIFQDTDKGFLEIAGKKKNIKNLETTSDLTEEEGVFLSAFTGLLNEQINTVPAGLNSIKQHNKNIKLLQEEVISETPPSEQTEQIDAAVNKREFTVKDNLNLIDGSKKISGEVTEKWNNSEFADKIESVKNFESANMNDSKSNFLIAKSDVQDTDIPIKNNKPQMDTIGADTTEKANTKIINNASELLELKNGNQINSKEIVLSEIHGSPEYRQAQSEAGSETIKKDIADYEQNIKKDNLSFFQKKEILFTGFDKSFDDNSGGRKEFFSKLESKAPAQNRFDKAPLRALEGGGVNYTPEEASPKVAELVFTQIEDIKNKDSNISKIQIGGEKIEIGHISSKTHFLEQSAGTVKADAPVQKPATAEVLPQIIDKAVLILRKGQNEIKISLKPESLGRIHLKIVTENQHVLVKIIADNPHVKELIENNLHHLKADLGNHGLAIDKFDVFMAGDFDKNSGKEGYNEFFKMKNREYTGRDSEQAAPDESEVPVALVEQDKGSNLIGVFA